MFGACLLLVVCFCATASFAQPILDVTVEGYAHVNPTEIQEKLAVKPGMEMDRSLRRTIRSDIRRLMDTGKFQDIVADLQEVLENGRVKGFRLVFNVLEKPVIIEYQITGNEAYRTKRLMNEMGIEDGQMLFWDESHQQRLTDKLIAFYRSKSYPETKVTMTTTPAEHPDELVLHIAVEEGTQLPVRDIIFEGNTVFDAGELRKNMQTKRSWWFIIKNEYDENLLQNDLKAIAYLYRDKGYLDVQVEAGELERVENGVNVHIMISEGELYTVDRIQLEGNTLYADSELLAKMTLLSGQTYSEGTLTRDLRAIRRVYQDQGYYFTRVSQELQPDRETKKVNIMVRVNESRRLRLGEVKIQGVVTTESGETYPTEEGEFSTKDYVVRRELRLKPGDVLDWSQVLESDRRLTNLQYFKAKPYPQPEELNLMPGFSEPIPRLEEDPTVADLLLRLEEVETGFLTFGGGYSTTFGPSVIVTLEKRNLLGRGWDSSITAELGTKRSRVVLSFTEPYLFDTEWSMTARTFWIDRKAIGGRTFDEERIGGSLTFGHEIFNEDIKGYIGLKGEQTDISEFSGSRIEAVDVPKEFQEGTNTTTSITFSAVRDTRDFVFNPTRGTLTQASLEVAGLSDNEFVKFETAATWYRRLFGKATLELGGQLSLAAPFGDNEFLPLQERYFVGGQNSVRGFQYGGIGRGDTLTRRVFLENRGIFENVDDFTVGGEAAFTTTAEIRYPFWDFLHGALFVDTGSVYPEIGDFDPSDLRISAGTGLIINLPIGAVARIDYGWPIVKDDDDEVEHLQFRFSQSLGR